MVCGGRRRDGSRIKEQLGLFTDRLTAETYWLHA